MEEELTESIGNVEIRQHAPGLGLREKSKKETFQFQHYIAVVVVCLIAFIIGTVIGWTAPVLQTLQSDKSPVGKMTDEETSWLESLTFLGGILGALFWGRIAERFGRKMAGYSVAAPVFLEWVMIKPPMNPAQLYISRFFTGLTGSGALTVCLLYVSEIVQDSLRGILGSYIILFMNGGIVAAYAIGAATNFIVFTSMCLKVPILFVVLFFFLPKTPSYLFRKRLDDEAETLLLWFRDGDSNSVQTSAADRRRKSTMVIGLVFFTWQQLCAILALLTFTTTIFKASGSSLNPSKITIIFGLVQLLGSYLSSFIVGRSGRRILLVISYTSMGISLSLLSAYFYALSTEFDVTLLNWLPVACLSVHVVAYTLSAGSVPYVVMSDILYLDIRRSSTSVMILWGTVFSFVNVQIIPFLVSYIGRYESYLFFGAFCFIGVVINWTLVVEKKGIPGE